MTEPMPDRDAPLTTADLPPLHDVLLDDDTVTQLFFDVGHAAELLAVSVKSPGARRADEPAAASLAGLDQALRALLEGRVAGVQLRYRHAGEEWWDTLARTPAGVRLIRISHTRALRCGGSTP